MSTPSRMQAGRPLPSFEGEAQAFPEQERAGAEPSARGGVAIAIAVELGLPVKLVGVGEGVDDLRPFDAGVYARAQIAG